MPDSVARLVKVGLVVRIERGAGAPAHFADAAYAAAGATVAPGAAELFGGASVIVKVRPPTLAEALLLEEGATLISFLEPSRDADLVRALAARRVSAFSMDLVPRITRAQAMDALSSQATVAGYRAVLLGAQAMGRFLPMLVTAAGTLPPATVFVLGAGVAGLQAIATARRLGAMVRAFDIRPAVKEQVESLGATFVATDAVVADSEDASGYARQVTPAARRRQEEAIAKHLAESDLVITTAQVPGKPAPILVTEAMVAAMKPGSIVVDLAAEAGGNCALTQPGAEVLRHGVTVLGPVNLASTMPTHASQMYGKNTWSLLQHLLRNGRILIDTSDEITRAMLVTHQGAIANREGR